MTVSDTYVGVDPGPQRWCKRVVGVDETAFGAFDMMGGEGVRDAAEAEGICWAVEGSGGHGYDA